MSRKPPAKIAPLTLDLSAAWNFESSVGRAALMEITPQLDAARQRVLAKAAQYATYWFVGAPQRFIKDYQQGRKKSCVAGYLDQGKDLRDEVDQLIVAGASSWIVTMRALFESCCHPYHNLLSRGQRGGRPKIHFLANAPDNDRLSALLDLLEIPRGGSQPLEDRWGLIVETMRRDEPDARQIAVQVFLPILQEDLEYPARNECYQRWRPVARIEQLMPDFTKEIAEEEIQDERDLNFPAPFTSADLTVGSAMGINVVMLMAGAAFAAESFQSQPVGDNTVLDFAGLCYLLRMKRGMNSREFAPLVSSFEGIRQWCELLPIGLGSSSDSLVLQLVPDAVRHDRLMVSVPRDRMNPESKKINRKLHDIALEEFAAIRAERATAGLPTAVIHLPAADEASLGQLMQMLLLAAAVEEELAKENC